ncbi:MAG: hypothetical protein LBG15_12475 [Dysgonamonadaceae bacterium]|jgi:hypothetical protein|nr:hypothetical protein [Dysgonamonadaceae bacterium]
MERFWNIIHFFAYKYMTKSYIIFIKPVHFLYNTNLSKKFLARNGRTPETAMKEFKFALTDKRVGQSSFFAYGIMFAMPFVFLFGLHNFLFFVFNRWIIAADKLSIYPIVIYGIFSYLLNDFLLLRKDKYIKYFKKFERQPREWKVKWAWISAGVILFPFLVLAGSFIAMLPE